MNKLSIKVAYDPEHGERYHLIGEEVAFWEKIKRLGLLVILPLNFLRFVIGRFLSFMLLEPFSHILEKDISLVAPNKQYPDPAFLADNQFVVIDILPKKNHTIRLLRNWIHEIKSRCNLIFSTKFNNEFSFITENDVSAVDKLLQQMEKFLTESPSLKPSQIHIKGLYYLTPGQRKSFFKQANEKYKYDFQKNQAFYNYFSLKTEMGNELDSVEISTPTASQQPIEERKFIVVCTTRYQRYYHLLKQHRYLADQLNATVVAFHYRGIAHSRGLGASANDVKEDILAQVRRLLALGAKSENIALVGECLTGNIAISATAQLHRCGYPVKLFHIRSFRSLALLTIGWIWPSSESLQLKSLSGLGVLFLPLIGLGFLPFAYFSGWDLSIEKDFLSIPVRDKDFITVRSKKNTEGQYYKDDPIVSHSYASIYSLVKEEQKILRQKAQTCLLSLEEKERLNDKRGTHKFHVDENKLHDAPIQDGHRCRLHYLKSTKNESSLDARDYMINFFRRQWKPKVLIDANEEAPMITLVGT